MRTAPQLAGLALAIAGLIGCAGCSGSDGAGGSSVPDSSGDDFCAVFNGFADTVLAGAAETDPSDLIRAVKEWAGDLEDLGPPSDMPGDARRGFERFVDRAAEIDEDATLADLEKSLGQDPDAREHEDSAAFTDWTRDTCTVAGSPTEDVDR
jgi:hypothetical protein